MKFISNTNDIRHHLGIKSESYPDPISNITFDSRKVKKSSFFICLKGESSDGNEFIDEALNKGASLILSNRKKLAENNKKIIYTPDTIKALRKISKSIINSFSNNRIGITGSNGKTTTTKIITKTLFNSSGTIKNFNNEIGMPLSIMNARVQAKNLVIEMGAAKFKDINYLSSILKPSIGIITNIGHSHLENLQNTEGVLKVKSELIPNITKGGYLIVPANNEKHLSYWKKIRSDIKVITFSAHKNADFIAKNIKESSAGMIFSIVSKNYDVDLDIKTDLMGMHNIENILAAYIVNFLTQKNNKYFQKKISLVDRHTSRQRKLDWINNSMLIDDSYNANPDSVKKSLELLSKYKERKLFIMGDMLELGKQSTSYHKQIGKYAADKGIDIILAIGDHTKHSANEFGENGFFFECEKELKDFINNNVKSNDIVLLKGSRGMKMERFINV
ncbi:MAG: UDP-N-acetylmuramoyl-tripeptide--D-alanyl-D-alanine ligase [Gammaproteobacteria bacterium]|tara:strand:- start:6108 stop:7448 length:1341 start_codon:yes stop_codon:yes gene_type:complete